MQHRRKHERLQLRRVACAPDLGARTLAVRTASVEVGASVRGEHFTQGGCEQQHAGLPIAAVPTRVEMAHDLDALVQARNRGKSAGQRRTVPDQTGGVVSRRVIGSTS